MCYIEVEVKIWSVFKSILLSVIMPSMLEGFCPKCGTHRIGHALRIPRYQTCHKCGAGLEITENGRRIGTGFSPFTADKYLPKPPEKVPKSEEQNEEKGMEKE